MTLLTVKYDTIKEHSVSGRYVRPSDIDLFLEAEKLTSNVEVLGKSVQGREIKCVNLGTGKTRILIWSHMHGNEGTTTKAILDLINTLLLSVAEAELILKACSLKIISMLNPDGAIQYTRENANGIDLNRDAQKLSQPESRVLRDLYNEFSPDYCFNMHDQRSIYSAGTGPYSAALSFLSPAADELKSITPAREKSMRLIVAMNEALRPMMGNQIGRYDDSFNLDCVGDALQSRGTPSVLFEAGHFPGDYEREETRKYVWYAMMIALKVISTNSFDDYSLDQYSEIPNNEKLYYDILVRNVDQIGGKYDAGESVGILYDERLSNNKIEFEPVIENIGKLEKHFGHMEYDCRILSDLKELQNNPKLKSLIF